MTTVKQLIEELQKLDPDTKVFVHGYEGGYSFASLDLEVKNFKLNYYSEWYYGPHEQEDDGEVKGIVL